MKLSAIDKQLKKTKLLEAKTQLEFYEKELERHTHSKQMYVYEEYRRIYSKLHDRVCYWKKKVETLEKEQGE